MHPCGEPKQWRRGQKTQSMEARQILSRECKEEIEDALDFLRDELGREPVEALGSRPNVTCL